MLVTAARHSEVRVPLCGTEARPVNVNTELTDARTDELTFCIDVRIGEATRVSFVDVV